MTKNNYQGALQHPINSGFDATSTATDVMQGISFSGKTVLITGGNTGIGLETTKILAAAGAKIIVLARDTEKAKQNLADIPNVSIEKMDLGNPASITAFSKKFISSGQPVHLLINNAGIMWVPLRRDARGIESQLAINHLGHFQLTAQLWPALKAANGARVINVSSDGHKFGSINFEDPSFFTREYETLQAYGQSKTAMILFAMELDRKAKDFNVRAFSLHPGSIHGTELAREAPTALFREMGFWDADGKILPEIAASLKTIPQGAATTLWCATSPFLQDKGGVYCEDCNIALLIQDESGTRGVKSYAVDQNNAKNLWALSEKLTGIEFKV